MRISEFGKYQGYSQAVYDGTQRTSDYLTLSDGTRLAYDVIIPTRKGVPASQRLPTLFKYTPYGRTWTIFDKQGNFLVGSDFADPATQVLARIQLWVLGDKGRFMDPLQRDKWLRPIVSRGYIVVSVDRPGTGASFPTRSQGSMETAAEYENEIINWIAAQSWSDGNVAMYGDSQQAMVQFAAASTGNPHLKAILPSASDVETYPSMEYPGGVFNKAFLSMYGSAVPTLDRLATAVDSDPDGILLAQARAERTSAITVQNAAQVATSAPFADSLAQDGTPAYHLMDLYPFIDRINRSHTAVYMTVGWYDIFTADMFYWYDNLSVPRHLTVRPTDHSSVNSKAADLDYSTEALRWLDYWLKGIDNGVMAEPPIHYYLQDSPDKGAWHTSDCWPVSGEQAIPYYFAPGRSGSTASVNDGTLAAQAPGLQAAADAYTVDYTTTTGPKSRWGAIEEPHAYPDLAAHDARSLTYTTPPLASDMILTGQPVVHLWLSTAAPDLDAFVYLEEVTPAGKSIYITEGDLRATHRKLADAPYKNFNLPYQTHASTDVEALPAGQPFEMVFSLLPSSYHIQAGNRIRITVSFADAGNFDTPVLTPAPSLQMLRETAHTSYVVLPVVQGQ